MSDAWIIDARRTPRGIGKAERGSLASLHPQRLAASVLCAIAERNGLDTRDVDDVVFGTSEQTGLQTCDLARMAALDAGYEVTASGVTLDRFCGSGITATMFAASSIAAGFEDVIVAGGVEMMSQSSGPPEGPFMDVGNLHLRALHPQTHQGVAADAIATLEGIPRSALDEFACESQRRANVAIQEGRFERSLVPVHDDQGVLLLDRDEHPRPGTTVEALAALPPAFAAIADEPLTDEGDTYRSEAARRYPGLDIQHMHHAGSSSGVVDGAAAILLTSAEYARAHGLAPRGRIVAAVNAGDDPTLMLNAPVPATRKVLARAGLTIDAIDLFEVNEAFAVVPERFIRTLGVDREKVNVNGGAIALGHPIGATGAILVGTVLDELERRGGRYGLVTMCAAGGMAPAMIIERVESR